MTPTERLADILNKLNLTSMPHYWAGAIVRELATHGITLEKSHGPRDARQNDLLPQRKMPTPGGMLYDRSQKDGVGKPMGKCEGVACADNPPR